MKQISTGKKYIYLKINETIPPDESVRGMRRYTRNDVCAFECCLNQAFVVLRGGSPGPTAPTSDAESGDLVLASNSSERTCG